MIKVRSQGGYAVPTSVPKSNPGCFNLLNSCGIHAIDCHTIYRMLACGKLARNLEALIERTEVWSSSTDRRTTSPSMPEILVRSGAMTTSALLASPGVLNGCWAAKLEPLHPHQNGQPPGSHDGGSQINGPPLYQEVMNPLNVFDVKNI